MLGTFAVESGKTFAAVVFMGASAKIKYGSTDQDITADGRLKWEVQAAVTFFNEFGMRPQAEVIAVTIASASDPAAGIPMGSPVELADFKLGFTQAELREKNGQAGIRGGKPYFQASAVRAVRPVMAGKSDG